MLASHREGITSAHNSASDLHLPFPDKPQLCPADLPSIVAMCGVVQTAHPNTLSKLQDKGWACQADVRPPNEWRFIPTHTGDRVTLACTFGNCICDLLQKPIAKSVSLAVIHWLEEVEVNKQQSRVRTVTA